MLTIRGSRLVAISLIFFFLQNSAVRSIWPVHTPYETSYQTCKSLRSAGYTSFGYLGKGVALNSASVKYTGAVVDRGLYLANQKLDTDNDGVACEHPIFDFNVTPNTPGVKTAYSACKSWREGEQKSILFYGQLDVYYNESDTLAAQLPFSEKAVLLMQQAAQQNSIFKEGAISAKAWTSYYKKAYSYLLVGKRFESQPPDYEFDTWCSLFGIYSSHRGMFPPIDIRVRELPRTPLNGARLVCQKLFSIAPHGQRLYSDDASINIRDCDANARSTAKSSRSYYDALERMKEIYFAEYEFWCWSRNNCVAEEDIE